MPEANITSGIIGVVGVLVGVGFKESWSRTQSERRANGKVLATIRRAHRECSTVKTKLHEKQDYKTDADFLVRQQRIWDLIDKSAEVEADNVLLISPKFSEVYWKFYTALRFPGSENMPAKERYDRADKDFATWLPKLQSRAFGAFSRSLAIIGAQIVGGFALGAIVAAKWTDIRAYISSLVG